MKFEDIIAEWDVDSNLDRTEIDQEALKIPNLHSKYYKIYVAEKNMLRVLEAQFKSLKLQKYEFYTQGHTKETREKGWELPDKGLILKADIPMYIDADPDIISASLKIGTQQEKVEMLENIIKSLNNRGYLLKTALDFIKWTQGAS